VWCGGVGWHDCHTPTPLFHFQPQHTLNGLEWLRTSTGTRAGLRSPRPCFLGLLMAIGDFFRASVLASLHGQTTINTFYYSQTVGTGVAEFALAANLANAILAADWWDGYLQLHVATWEATRINVQQIATTPPPGILSPTYDIDIVDAAGQATGISLPSSSAVVVRRRTTIAGRKGMGRIFLCGFPADWTENSVVLTEDAEFTAASGAFLAAINTDLVNTGITWSPRHYSPSALVTTAAPIRQWSFDSVLRNQRRRQVGVGV